MWCQHRLAFTPINKLQPTIRLLNFPFFSPSTWSQFSVSFMPKIDQKKKQTVKVFKRLLLIFASLDITGLSPTYIIALNKITLCVFAKHIRPGQVSHQNRL